MARTMTLAELGLTGPRGQEAQVTGLSLDSRSVERGHLFGAMPGATIHPGSWLPWLNRVSRAQMPGTVVSLYPGGGRNRSSE